MNIRTRLAKIEAQIAKEESPQLSPEELVTKINEAMYFAAMQVLWHLNHPSSEHLSPSINKFTLDDVTLQMIADCEQCQDADRNIARILIEAGCRKSAHDVADLI